MSDFINISAPSVGPLEKEYVAKALDAGWISFSGEFVDRFEEKFSQECQSEYAIPVSNGTVALHLALLSLGVGPGDKVIVPSMTFVATANAVKHCSATPIFVDVDRENWCIDVEDTKRALEQHPDAKGIIAVHIYGQPSDMDALGAVAREHDIWIIEDAAEAHFAEYKGRPVGGIGAAGTFSFFSNKIIACGEGGAVTVNDPHLYSEIMQLKNHGADPKRRYYFPRLGYNYRLTNVACALLCAQLDRKEEILSERTKMFEFYQDRLSGIPGVKFQKVEDYAKLTPWIYSVVIDETEFGMSRDQLIHGLKENGVDSRPFFYPLHRLPMYVEDAAGIELPASDFLGFNGISLPTYVGISEHQLDRVCLAVEKARR